MKIDSTNRQHALNIIKDDYPAVHETLARNWDKNFAVGFIDWGGFPGARPVGIQVDGEILNLAVGDFRKEHPHLSDPDVKIELHKKIDEFMRRKFPNDAVNAATEHVMPQALPPPLSREERYLLSVRQLPAEDTKK